MRLLIFMLILTCAHAAHAARQCVESGRQCSAGPATILIDGMEITRPCWTYTQTFTCIEEVVLDTCGDARARGCTLQASVCQQSVIVNGAAQCITEQREYQCKVGEEASSTVADCAGQQFCIEGNCFDTGSVPDPDFGRAVAGMEAAREAGVYVDESTFQVFKGADNRCTKSVVKNCCKGNAKPTTTLSNLALQGGNPYAFDVLGGPGLKSTLALSFDPAAFALSMAAMVVEQMLACDRGEVLTAVKRGNGLCHYTGDYCSRTVDLGLTKICVQHTETHCCYNSKIARILNQGARAQLPGLGWGSPQQPACGGLSLAQFQALDLARVDFSDFYADIEPAQLDEPGTLDNAAAKVRSYFGQ